MTAIDPQVRTDIRDWLEMNIADFRATAADIGRQALSDGYADDDEATMDLTVSVNSEATRWSFQTGDNSYEGSCYGDPHWAVVGVGEDSTVDGLHEDIIEQLEELLSQETE